MAKKTTEDPKPPKTHKVWKGEARVVHHLIELDNELAAACHTLGIKVRDLPATVGQHVHFDRGGMLAAVKKAIDNKRLLAEADAYRKERERTAKRLQGLDPEVVKLVLAGRGDELPEVEDVDG